MKKLFLIIAFVGAFTSVAPNFLNAQPVDDEYVNGCTTMVIPCGGGHTAMVCDEEDARAWVQILCFGI